MVKPPKTMQPEAVNLKKAGRSAGKAFQEDSFHNYMARKIDMQRKQFGLMLPLDPNFDENAPEKPPEPPKKKVEFAPEQPKNRKRKGQKFGIGSVLKRLKRKHGSSRKPESQDSVCSQSSDSAFATNGGARPEHEPLETIHEGQMERESPSPKHKSQLESDRSPPSKVSWRQVSAKQHPGLFFIGVVVLVNGYTNPDNETLQRLLHKHGGDLEKYETSRITHIIAQNLSAAKAKMYKKMRNPRPVCKPCWITDSVKAGRLLPEAAYIIDEMKNDITAGMQSVASFYRASKGGSPKPVSSADDVGSPQSESSVTAPEAHSLGQASQDEMDVCDDGNSEVADEKTSQAIQVAQVNDSGAVSSAVGPEDVNTDRYVNGRIRTVGTDPHFLESFFASSRLSFIGSYKQRARTSPKKTAPSGPKERFVFHVDMDCFFASVALRNFPEYRDKPVVISHHGENNHTKSSGPVRDVPNNSSSECATCNYEARKYGITKGMYLGRAKALCPDLVVLKYDFEGYEEVSEAVTDILQSHASEYGGYVEQVSCDEAYVELRLARQSGDNGKPPRAVVAELAEIIRKEILEVTQCTATVGVASNKLLAKLATDRVKPNKSFIVHDSRDLLKPLQLRDLHGVGYRFEQKLEEEGLLSVQDVWDLGNRGEAELCRVLGPAVGKKIFGFCQGKDDRPVQPAERKTIGAECNYGVRFEGPYGVDYMIEGLCKEVEKRMINVGVKGAKVTLKVKERKQNAPPPPKYLGHGSCHNLSKSSDTSNGMPTREWQTLYDVAAQLFADMAVPKEDIRGMGIVVSKLTSDGLENSQATPRQSIANWFSGNATTLSRDRTSSENGEQRKAHVAFSSLVANAMSSDQNNSGHGAISVSVIDLSVENAAENTASADDNDEYNDVALPDLSQIRMSQVEELPSPLRRRIVSKMETEKAAIANDVGETIHADVPRELRFRQTDVKRMFRLAALKTGEQDLAGEMGASISMTQLERLPLEVQLQVANDDQRKVGLLSPEKRRKKSPRSRHKFGSRAKQPSPKTRPANIACRLTTTDTAEAVIRHLACSSHAPVTVGAFYRENVLPLSIFMDENPGIGQETKAKVVEFLCLCLSENRLSDVSVLLRSIKNRDDLWSSLAFDSIYSAVDEKVEEVFGSRLDREWVLQV